MYIAAVEDKVGDAEALGLVTRAAQPAGGRGIEHSGEREAHARACSAKTASSCVASTARLSGRWCHAAARG